MTCELRVDSPDGPIAPEPAEPVLEQRERTIEIAPQLPRGGRAVLAGERLAARGPEDLSVDADQEPGGDPRVAGVDPLLLEGIGNCLSEQRHDLELLGLERRRVLENAREDREARTRQACTLADLHPTQRRDDRLAVGTRSDRLCDHPRTFGNLVEEEVFLRREIVVDGLLRHAGLGCDLGDRDAIEAALHEEPHHDIRDLLPRRELLRLPQAHNRIVTWLIAGTVKFQPLYGPYGRS